MKPRIYLLAILAASISSQDALADKLLNSSAVGQFRDDVKAQRPKLLAAFKKDVAEM